MSKCKVVGRVMVLASVFVVCAGCPKTPDRVYAPPISPSAGADALAQYDTNKDGKISGEELDKCPAIKAAIEQIDKEKTGGVTADMITARIKDWKDSKLGRQSASCTVTCNSHPLADAEVKFVPEKFLGDKLQTATGKTDANGQAALSVPLDAANPKDLPGVPPGLYRVEITKAGENIPAKYNTQTILGQEVAQGAKGQVEGIKFNLIY